MRIELRNESLTYTSKYLVLRKDTNNNIVLYTGDDNEVLLTKEEALELSNTLKFMIESA